MIAFSGIDGAGKSTQIDLLKDYLELNGKKVLVFWSRGGYTPGMIFVKKLLGFSANENKIKHSESRQHIKREKSLSNPTIRKLWLILSIIDLICYYSIYIRIKEIFGITILCDRYIKDTEIDFRLNFPQERFYNWWLWSLLEHSSTIPEKHFVATIPVDESIRRSKLKNEPFPDSKQVLDMRLEIYRKFAREELYTVGINGLNTIEEIHAHILFELNLIVE